MLLNTHKEVNMDPHSFRFTFPDVIKEKHSFLIFGTIGRGESFGEDTALGDDDARQTIEVASEVAEIYKIHRTVFVQHFGGQDGTPCVTLRS